MERPCDLVDLLHLVVAHDGVELVRAADDVVHTVLRPRLRPEQRSTVPCRVLWVPPRLAWGAAGGQAQLVVGIKGDGHVLDLVDGLVEQPDALRRVVLPQNLPAATVRGGLDVCGAV